MGADQPPEDRVVTDSIPGHAHSETPHSDDECWVPIFVAWAEGEVDLLDFEGREIPQRLQRLLSPPPSRPKALLAIPKREDRR